MRKVSLRRPSASNAPDADAEGKITIDASGLCALLMDRTRLLIMVKLAGSAEGTSFTALLESLSLTRGNLSTHMQRLEAEGFVSVSKAFVERKPLTTYRCTEAARAVIEAHLRAIESMIKQVAG